MENKEINARKDKIIAQLTKYGFVLTQDGKINLEDFPMEIGGTIFNISLEVSHSIDNINDQRLTSDSTLSLDEQETFVKAFEDGSTTMEDILDEIAEYHEGDRLDNN